MKKLKYKYRKLSNKITILKKLKKEEKNIFYKKKRIFSIKKNLRKENLLMRKMDLAVAFLEFYSVKQNYKYSFLKEFYKKKVKKPKFKKLTIKINRKSYTKNSILKFLLQEP